MRFISVSAMRFSACGPSERPEGSAAFAAPASERA
jgi:hypothetical protein